MTSKPPWLGGDRLPSRVTTSATIPGSGRVAEPGLVGVAPGTGLIMMPPVSVCHQVSTIGQRLAADDLVVPHPGLRVDRLADRAQQAQAGQVVLADHSSPHFMKARIAVGAV